MASKDFRLLYPLDAFYAERGIPLPEAVEIAGETMPEPYRRLLVGAHDMTPTLEAFYDDRIRLNVLHRHLTDTTLTREVVLSLGSSAQRVEFGAIVIHLEVFPPDARAAVVACRMPLGTILATYHVAHRSCPQAYIQVQSDRLIRAGLQLAEPGILYGRRNYLLTPDNRILADIVELLPPHSA